jgi:vancomycin permeability regulator SanA
MKIKFRYFLLLFLLWFAVHETIIIADGLRDEKVNCEFAVILGSKVNDDGTLSDRLQARLDAGLELYRSHIVQKLFVSGGIGKEGFPEGDKMAEYLIQQGVAQNDIVTDNQGTTTRKTVANFSKQFPDCNSVIVVSQYFHISRCKLAMKQAGIENVYGVHARCCELRDVFSLFREFFAWYVYRISG